MSIYRFMLAVDDLVGLLWRNRLLSRQYGFRFDDEGRITYGWPY
jgi:hypothetical protein